MKKILILLIILIFPSVVWAVPYLICDPQTGVSYYVATGTPTCMGDVSNIPAQSDGSLKIDVSCVAQGTNYSTTWKACNVWGDCSSTTPFVLTRPISPGAPMGIKLSK